MVDFFFNYSLIGDTYLLAIDFRDNSLNRLKNQMIHTLQIQNIQIKKEADEILYTRGILNILKLYGLPHVSGSYELDLMTRRDLEIQDKDL